MIVVVPSSLVLSESPPKDFLFPHGFDALKCCGGGDYDVGDVVAVFGKIPLCLLCEIYHNDLRFSSSNQIGLDCVCVCVSVLFSNWLPFFHFAKIATNVIIFTFFICFFFRLGCTSMLVLLFFGLFYLYLYFLLSFSF